MKTVLFLLFTLLAAGVLQASPPCDTILLKNGKKVPARAIAVTESEVRYQRCPDSSDVVFGFPIGFVKGIISDQEFRSVLPDVQPETAKLKESEADSTAAGPTVSVPAAPAPLAAATTEIAAGIPGRKWIFRRKADGEERRLTQGQLIRLRTENKNGSYRKQIGSLHDLHADTLFLSDKKLVVSAIALKDIDRIEMLKPNAQPYGLFAKIAFWLFVGIGFGVLFIALLFLSTISSLTGKRRDKNVNEVMKPFYLLGAINLIAGIAFGVGYLVIASPAMIPEPSVEWTWAIESEAPAQEGEQPVP